MHQVFLAGVKRLLFLGGSCVCPKAMPQPMREDALLTGVLEPTNEPYAVAKIAGIKLCESYNRQYAMDYRSVMPTNPYDPNDFHPENSHVVLAMLRRFHEAKLKGAVEVVVWRTGTPKREFFMWMIWCQPRYLCWNWNRHITKLIPMPSHINVGTGADVTIRELAETIARVTGFTGKIVFDTSKPDGTPRKLMNVSRLANLGWRASMSLDAGLANVYQWFLTHQEDIRV